MAGNEWLNGYLEAILDAGGGGGGRTEDSAFPAPTPATFHSLSHFNPTRYFVFQVVSGFDESDIHRTWMQATATKNTQQRNTRLENMSWRIWHLARRNKQIELEMAKHRLQCERAHKDATEDMSEDYSEGEKMEGLSSNESASAITHMPRVSSVDIFSTWLEEHKDNKRVYIVLLRREHQGRIRYNTNIPYACRPYLTKSIHGLVRGTDMELGRDSDTGGQIKYVVELARALAMMPPVYRVDLLTRQIHSPEVDSIYAQPIEMISFRDERAGESSGAYIVRIPFGPKDKYLRKELLWPYIQEFSDGSLRHILKMSKILGEEIGQGEPVWPYAIHGHYADAGDAAALLSGALNVPMVFTGHSLGRNKLDQLLKQGRQTKEEINAVYKIERRIEAEELALDASELIVTSTKQEIEEQWGLYDAFDVKLEKFLRAKERKQINYHGKFIPRMVVIPPGMEFNEVVDHDEGYLSEGDPDANGDMQSPRADPAIWTEIMHFFTNPRKPMILALARPDPKKNITTLVKAFGECRQLRDLANLTLIMGNRDDIDEMSGGNAAVLITTLKLIDKYDLYGQVAYPKHHKQSEVSDIYRLAARTKGVFINPAFIEPFGLTLIEAAAHGLPIVATQNGGPVDILRVLNNGVLVDPHNHNAIAEELLKLLGDRHLWAECRRNGLKNIYLFSWPEHCKTYISKISSCRSRQPQWASDNPADEAGDPIMPSNGLKSSSLKWRQRRLFVIAVDCYYYTSEEEETTLHFASVVRNILEAARKFEPTAPDCGLVLASALTLSELLPILKAAEVNASDFDAIICSSGSELYYPTSPITHSDSDSDPSSGTHFSLDLDYQAHISYRWGGHYLKRTLSSWKVLKGEHVLLDNQLWCNTHCFAYHVKDRTKCPKVAELRQRLRMQAFRCRVVYCCNATRLYVIPLHASRSQALRYLFVRWGVDIANMVLFVGEKGDSDYEQLLSGMHRTVVLKGAVEKVDDDRPPILSPYLVSTNESFDSEEIVDALKCLS